MTIILEVIRAVFIGTVEFLNEQIGPNMGGDPLNLVKLWNTKGVNCHIPSENDCSFKCDDHNIIDFTEK